MKLEWETVSKCHESLEIFVWLFFVGSPRTINDLQFAISDISWRKKLSPDRILLGVVWGVGSSIRKETEVDFENYYLTLAKILPDYASKVLFILINGFNDIYYHYSAYEKFLRENSLQNYLKAINYVKNFPIDQVWLSQSKHFIEEEEPEEIFDIFTCFLKSVKGAKRKNYIKKDETLQEANSFIRKLIRQRDSAFV
jgi:hypothetical protein